MMQPNNEANSEKIEFFLKEFAPISNSDSMTIMHHFNYAMHYMPTKFGRSTLRRVDYVKFQDTYLYHAQRQFILVVYLPHNARKVTLSLDTHQYTLKTGEINRFFIPANTAIEFSSLQEISMNLFEYDTNINPSIDDIKHQNIFDSAQQDQETVIKVHDITNSFMCMAQEKPYFAYLLEGDLSINQQKLLQYEAFYTTSDVSIEGKAKIITFAMPVPL